VSIPPSTTPTSRKSRKYEPYGIAVLAELMKGVPLTTSEIQVVVNDVAKSEKHSTVPDAISILRWLRGELGFLVIALKGRRGAMYTVSKTAGGGHSWIKSRRQNIRNQIASTLETTQDTLSMFDADLTTVERHDLKMVAASLTSAVTILDASLGGGAAAAAV
jgi:hypothetical protein